MNWKSALTAAFLGSVLVFVMLTVSHGRASHLSSQDHIWNAVESIALALGFIGSGELRQGGHRRARRILDIFLIISTALFPILFCIVRLWKRTELDLTIRYSLYSFLAIYATAFPLSLYLNRKQPKSNSQPTIDNVS
ncbi:MAG: hypothetical protein ABR924_03380 [Terracidiphilus sp.]|jgi:hypothetical protein